MMVVMVSVLGVELQPASERVPGFLDVLELGLAACADTGEQKLLAGVLDGPRGVLDVEEVVNGVHVDLFELAHRFVVVGVALREWLFLGDGVFLVFDQGALSAFETEVTLVVDQGFTPDGFAFVHG